MYHHFKSKNNFERVPLFYNDHRYLALCTFNFLIRPTIRLTHCVKFSFDGAACLQIVELESLITQQPEE